MGSSINNWETVAIGYLGQVITGSTPSSKYPELFGSDYPFITPTDIDNSCRYIETERFLSEQGKENQSSRILPPGAVCVVCIGATIGKICMTNRHSCTNQQINSIIVNQTKYDNSFVYYLLRTKKELIKSIAGGAATPIVNKTAFSNIEVLVPPLPTQKIITAILSAYDDLIENNNRRIRILEEIAKLIYQEWFVNFRFPSHENVNMVDSPLGPIPERWIVKEMREVAGVIDCLHSKKPQAVDNGTKLLLQLFNIADGGKIDLSKRYLISDDDYALWTSRIEASPGDCVITNVGRIAAVAQIPNKVKAALGRNMTAVRANPQIMTPSFLIQYLLSPSMEKEVQLKKDSGTIMDSLNVKGIVKLLVTIPTIDSMSRFDSIVRPIRHRIELLMEQNANLRKTRDLLLPKLISGELDVSELAIEVSGEVL